MASLPYHLKQHIQYWLSHSGFEKYAKNTSWLFLTRIISMGFSFFVTAATIRYLGPTHYGQLSYALSFVSLFSFIASFGIDQVLYRDLISHPDKKNVYLGTAFVMKSVAGFAATCICITSAYLFSTHDVSLILIFILSGTFICNSFSVIIYEFQARVESKYPSLVALTVIFILNILKILVIIFNKGVIFFATVLLFESILTAILYCYIRIRFHGSLYSWRYNSDVARRILSDSWPLIFSSLFALIYTRIDQIFIKHMIDTASVGLYDAAVRISEAWYFIPNILVGSLFPAIINAKQHSLDEYNKRLGSLALLLTLLAVAIAIPITIGAPFIIHLLYGSAFLGGVAVLQIYMWSGIGTSLANLATSYLIAENERRILFISYLIATASNVILNIILIPPFGIIGSAWATLISYSLGPISLLFFNKTRQKVYDIIKIYYNVKKHTT